jgi:hypothetical protein
MSPSDSVRDDYAPLLSSNLPMVVLAEAFRYPRQRNLRLRLSCGTLHRFAAVCIPQGQHS